MSEIIDTIETAAKRLKLGVEGRLTAEKLEAIALAMRQGPHGYIAVISGAAYRHDLCRPSREDVRSAAIAAGLAPAQFTVEPFIVLRE